MKIVFFANKCSHAAALLKQLQSSSIPIEAIFVEVEKPGSQDDVKRAKRYLKKLGPIETVKVIYNQLRKRYAPRTKKAWHSIDFYYAYSDRVYIVNNFNGKQCERLLKEIGPDIVVLGGTRIIHKHIIDIPKIGILNSHPGLLPKYRGIDVIPWAIYEGNPIGATIHFIDEGVNTGGIVVQKVIEITEGDTLATLRSKTLALAGELMAQTVLKIMEDGHIETIPQRKENGKQYYKMPESLLQETKIKLRGMINERKDSAEATKNYYPAGEKPGWNDT